MSKYVCVGDVHATERPPSSCTDRYLTDLLEMLAEVNRIAANVEVGFGARGASGIIWAGDVFHHKAPSRTSHRLVMAMLSIIEAAHPCTVYIVPGNHDIQHDRLESLSVTQPLGVLLRSLNATLLDGWERNADAAPLMEPDARVSDVYGVPWQQTWDDEHVREALAGWRDSGPELPALVVTHAPLYPPGCELPYENYPAVKFAEAMGNKGSVFYGHVHEPHGTYEVDGVTFCNNGALSRGSLHEYNLTRKVCATVWDSLTGEFEEVPLMSAPPAKDVFRLTEKQEVTDVQGRLDEFLRTISSATLEVVSVESVIEHVRGMGLEEPVTALIEELVEEASHHAG